MILFSSLSLMALSIDQLVVTGSVSIVFSGLGCVALRSERMLHSESNLVLS